ncbi:hypothetical protein LINPERPRIM_LOCUS15602 [Linum perenne]
MKVARRTHPGVVLSAFVRMISLKWMTGLNTFCWFVFSGSSRGPLPMSRKPWINYGNAKGFVTLDLLAPRLGREKAIMDGSREFWVYFQYEKVQAICFRCGIIGHVLKRCLNPHLPLDLEARNDWICVEESGEEIDDIFLLKKSEEKKWAKKNQAKLPPAVLNASSTLMLRGHEHSEIRGGAGKWGGNRQSSLLARSVAKNVVPSKVTSSTKSSLPSQGSAGFRNTYNRSDNRKEEAQPPSKRKLSYEEKGKGKMQWKEKKLLKANPRQNRGIIIREPSDRHGPTDNQKGRPQHHIEHIPSPLIMGEEDEANSDRNLGDILGLTVPGGGVKELQKDPKAFSPQVPLFELEKAVRDFETRKMQLFGQDRKGTGRNPISITDGSLSPSDLFSSARGPNKELEAAYALFDMDDYADAALEIAETDMDGGGSGDNLNDILEENEGMFGLVDGCFGADRFIDDFEKIGSNSKIPNGQEFELADMDEHTEGVEVVPDSIASLERPEHTNSRTREELFTLDLVAARKEENGKILDPEMEEANLVDGCLGADRPSNDFEKIGSSSKVTNGQEVGLANMDENTEGIEVVPDSFASLENPEHTNFRTREEPFTSDFDAARKEDNGKILDPEVEEASLEWPQNKK